MLITGLFCSRWRVKDSNLRSFRDGFTVRSHWPLGQPAWASPPRCSLAAENRIAVAAAGSATGYGRHVGGPWGALVDIDPWPSSRSLIMAASPSFDIVSKVEA